MKANSAQQEARIGKPADLRPIGHTFEKILAGDPLDKRSKSYRAVYTVVAHQPVGKDSDGIYREMIERTKFERLDT